MANCVIYHLHDETSLLDSCTNFKLYVDRAKELGQKAICFTNHGTIFNWVAKKMYCEENGIKYLHGIETYLTETHDTKVRDNYHTILIARNYEGFLELNKLVDMASQADHKYYKDRISFDEFLSISDNIIKISACLQSPLNRLAGDNPYYVKLLQHYDYYEVQPHVNSQDQKDYNRKLYELSLQYGKPLIAGTDTHSLDKYKAECRTILQVAKNIIYSDEDAFDLTYKSYDELVEMFRLQDALPEDAYLQAVENTNTMADSVEGFDLDLSFKYPKLYDDEEEAYLTRIHRMYSDKLKSGAIKENPRYLEDIEEEFAVFKKLGMIGFMLFMSELAEWCEANGIPRGPCRGSVGGSTIAYLTDITDVDPIVWNTVFSRFCNEDRLEIGDIDLDFSPDDREKVYHYIIDRFGADNTAYILTTGTVAEKGTIDEIGRAFHYFWKKENGARKETDSPYHNDKVARIKAEYEANPERAKARHSELFYYFDGLLGTVISQGIHPAGMVASPVSLPDQYGTFWSGDKRVTTINMEEIHEVSLVKYDILGLKNIGVIRDTCKLVGIPYPKAHQIYWEEEAVWKDITTSPAGVFQFESSYAFDSLKKFQPQRINDMSMVNAAIRPSGASYRDKLFSKQINRNPSRIIDELLKDNNGFLIFQEDTIKFLKNICGLTGSEADNVRRAIGRKNKERLDAALPQILDGYCTMSDRPREVAEQEAKAFLQIIEDSSNYQFGFNHSTGYSMIGYMCAMLRYHYPQEFITALLNNADNEADIVSGTELASLKKIKIRPIQFRFSRAKYTPGKETKSIYKGIESIKFCNASIGEELYRLRNNKYDSFIELLYDLTQTSCDARQLDILIRLDFFREFGNSQYLTIIRDDFVMFKQGAAKQMRKDKIEHPVLQSILERHSRATEKTYLDLDVKSILLEIDQYLQTRDIDDFSIRDKIATQKEYLGYIDVQTGRPEDKHKLLALSVTPLKTKDKTRIWAYKIKTAAMYSGKNSEITVYAKVFDKNPISELDTILVKREQLQRKEWNGYVNWYAQQYKVLKEVI